MKKALCLLTVFSGVTLAFLRADPAPSAPDLKSAAPLQPPSSGLNLPAISTDFQTTDPEEIAEQTLALQAEQKQRASAIPLDTAVDKQREAESQDWMLRGYEAALEKRGLAQHTDQDPFTLPVNAPDPGTALPLKSAVDPLLPPPTDEKKKPADPAVLPERDVLSASAANSSFGPTELAPLLPPLASQRHDQPRDTGMEGFAKETGTVSEDNSVLDMPGMTAATQNGMITPDVDMDDHLPDQPEDATKPHDETNDFILPTGPKNDVSDFMHKQAESLLPPTAPTVRTVATAPPIVAPPTPIKPQPVTTGLRSHVADPFDYLSR